LTGLLSTAIGCLTKGMADFAPSCKRKVKIKFKKSLKKDV
jgi:hypothetical protein